MRRFCCGWGGQQRAEVQRAKKRQTEIVIVCRSIYLGSSASPFHLVSQLISESDKSKDTLFFILHVWLRIIFPTCKLLHVTYLIYRYISCSQAYKLMEGCLCSAGNEASTVRCEAPMNWNSKWGLKINVWDIYKLVCCHSWIKTWLLAVDCFRL